MMYSEKVLRSLSPPVFEFYFLKVSRLGVAKQKSYTSPSNRFHEPEIWKSWIFPKYWRWWGVQASKFMKSARRRDFNALRRAHVSFTWLVEWLHPKSNIVYKGNCSTKGGRLIRRFSNFDLDFRDHECVFWKCLKIVVSACVWVSFSESILVGRCEAKTLYVSKQPGPWTGNLEIMILFSKILTMVKGSGL